jgi:hypothetical protein
MLDAMTSGYRHDGQSRCNACANALGEREGTYTPEGELLCSKCETARALNEASGRARPPSRFVGWLRELALEASERMRRRDRFWF